MSQFWIQKAIRNPGSFTRYAQQHHGLKPSGGINPDFIQHVIQTTHNPTLHRRAVLARTLQTIAKKRGGKRRFVSGRKMADYYVG